MIELKGSLRGIGLLPIVQLLAEAHETGYLRVLRGRQAGELAFEDGRLVAVSFRQKRGLEALTSLARSLPDAGFEYTENDPPEERNVDLTLEQLKVHLAEIGGAAGSGTATPSLRAVPRLVMRLDAIGDRVELERGTLRTLLAVNGERTVAEIIGDRPLLPALRELDDLVQQGLISIDPARPAVQGVIGIDPPARPAVPSPSPAVATPVGGGAVNGSRGLPARPPASVTDARPARIPPPPQRPRIEVPVEMPAPEVAQHSVAPAPCPKLAFADDPTHRYSRPTGLHRCYATGSAALVSPQEQRDLCLSGQFATCPRLAAAGGLATDELPTLESPVHNGKGTRGYPPLPPSPPAPAPAAQPTQPPPEPPVDARPGRRGTRRRLLLAGSAAVVVLAALLMVGLLVVAPRLSESASPSPPRLAATPVAPGGLAQQPRAPAAPTVAPRPPQATATPAPQARSSGQTAPDGPVLLDARFSSPQNGWLENAPFTAWSNGAFRLAARQPTRFVAIGAPLVDPPADLVVSATLRKVSGPPGGGCGIIVRDQGPGPRDGANQDGKYYVLAVGDRGDFGIWRRDGDRWVDLVAWTRSAAVRPGGSPNELVVSAIGDRLVFLINGTEVADQTDSTLPTGGVGVFVGGDANEVALDRFTVQTPD